MSISVRTLSVVLASVAGSAQAGLIVDQVGATIVGGGYSTRAAQSFRPAIDNIAAIEVYIYSNAQPTTVTVSLYDTYSGGTSLSGLLATTTLTGVARDTFALALFDQPVSVTPEAEYYFLVEVASGVVAGQRSTPSPYDRGQVLFAGGNIQGGDLVFRTFAIPGAGTGATVALAGVFASRRRRA
jgi:hypothetical protein